MIEDIETLLMIFMWFIAVPGILAVPVCAFVIAVTRSTLPVRVRRPHLVWGPILSMIGIVVMALTAWHTREDQTYDDFATVITITVGAAGGELFLVGLCPLTLWLLEIPRRYAARLPQLIRLAARDVAGGHTRVATMTVTTMIATAFAITIMIVSAAETTQHRAEYRPEARPGALLAEVSSTEEAATARATIRRELPGVPIAHGYRVRDPQVLHVDVENAELPDLERSDPVNFIGDRALLRYLTGDPATPYDEDTAVVVTTHDAEVDRVMIHSGSPGDDEPLSQTVPAVLARPADPHIVGIFLPAEVILDLGYHLEPDVLIIAPSVHRTSVTEQERIARQLEDVAYIYVERGFQAPTSQWIVITAALLVALGGALAATAKTTTTSRARRVLSRVSGGSTTALRLSAACRAGFIGTCGTVMGAVAGCVIGLFLAWPMTASIDWEPVPRGSFDTPWSLIATVAGGLPLLVAAVAALSTRGD